MNPNVDDYLVDGCGRCSYYKTPKCKVNTWVQELMLLRNILLKSGLKEEYKWSQPCYTWNGKNVAILSALKDYASLAFFKGSLLEDPENLLHTPGKSSQASRLFKFTGSDQVKRLKPIIENYLKEAIELERAGKEVVFAKNPEPIPGELQQKMDEDPSFKQAFEGLTSGLQRGYILHFSQPKRKETRISRIEKYRPNILRGEGIHDAWKKKK